MSSPKNPLGQFALLLVLSVGLLSGCVSSGERSDALSKGNDVCAHSSDESSLEEIRIINNGGLATAPYIEWGSQQGCFAKHGLRVVVQDTGGANAEKLASLVGGSADVASESIGELVTAVVESGEEFRLVAGTYEYTEEQLRQAKNPELVDGRLVLEAVLLRSPGVEYESPQDLVGKTIGVSAGRGQIRLAIEGIAEDAGIDPGSLRFVGGSTSERMALFRKGQLDFFTLSGAAVFEALDEGAEIVLYPGAYIYQPGAAVIWYTTKKISVEKEAKIAAFQRAVLEINGLLYGTELEEDFRTFLVEDFGLESKLVERYSMPRLVTRDLTIQEFEYIVPILIGKGIIRPGFTIPEDLIFVGSK